MKWFSIILLIVLVPSYVLFNKTLAEVHRQLNIHSTEDKVNSVMAQTAEVKYFKNSDGQKLAYWYFPVKNSKAVVILAHGFSNPGGKSQMIAHALYLKKAGYTTIIPDLRSFGDSEGQKIYLGTKEWQDLVDVYDLVKSFPETKNQKIGYLGVSMGAASSITAVAQSGKGDFVIASVPFKSFDSLAKFRMKDSKYLPILGPFINLAGKMELGNDYQKYSAINNVGNVHVPIIIFKALKDEFVASQDARDIFNEGNGPKDFWAADSTHDIHYNLPKEFEKHVLDFLEKYIQ